MPLLLLKFLPFLGARIQGLAKINWKIAGPALGIIVLMAVIHFKNNTIDDQAAVIAVFVTELQEAVAANRTNQETIGLLEKANSELAEAAVVTEEVRAAADDAAQDRARRAQVRLDDARTQLRNLENETPTCAQISHIDIGAACPLSVELLRRAAAGNPD